MSKYNIFKYLLASSVVLFCYCCGNNIASAQRANLVSSVGANGTGIFATGKDVGRLAEGIHQVEITIHFTAPNTNPAWGLYPKLTKRTNGVPNVLDPSKSWKYFMATNSFCGFIELRDADGKKLNLLKPQVNLQKAYPASYSLKLMRQILDTGFTTDGSTLPTPLVGADVPIGFNLKDYFKVQNPGEYQLTVWPKIYKRSTTNGDLCERIDLAPVTIPITIKWAENNNWN